MKLEEVIVDLLRTLESTIIENQFNIAKLLNIFGEESFSEDGKQHIKRLKKK